MKPNMLFCFFDATFLTHMPHSTFSDWLILVFITFIRKMSLTSSLNGLFIALSWLSKPSSCSYKADKYFTESTTFVIKNVPTLFRFFSIKLLAISMQKCPSTQIISPYWPSQKTFKPSMSLLKTQSYFFVLFLLFFLIKHHPPTLKKQN